MPIRTCELWRGIKVIYCSGKRSSGIYAESIGYYNHYICHKLRSKSQSGFEIPIYIRSKHSCFVNFTSFSGLNLKNNSMPVTAYNNSSEEEEPTVLLHPELICPGTYLKEERT